MSKEWVVSVPIVGRMDIFVTAETEEAAEAAALSGEWTESEIVETEVVRECRGNVCHLSSGIDVIVNE